MMSLWNKGSQRRSPIKGSSGKPCGRDLVFHLAWHLAKVGCASSITVEEHPNVHEGAEGFPSAEGAVVGLWDHNARDV